MSPARPDRILQVPEAARLLVCAAKAGEDLGAFTRLALVAGPRRGELLAIR